MKLDKDKIWENANSIYAVRKLKAMGYQEKDWAYLAPERIPQIASNQVYAMMEAIVDEINDKGLKPPMTPNI